MLAISLHDAISGSYWIGLFGTAATVAVILMVFAETGLLVGFFLPGDSLLFVAGLYSVHRVVKAGAAAPPHLNLALLLPGVIIASILGSLVGYLIGRKAGDTLFNKPDSRLFKQEYVARTREFLERYGESKAVLLSRFIPIVRTFMNPAVGVVKMPRKAFMSINILSSVIWAGGVTTLGAVIGRRIPEDKIDYYILPIVATIIIVTAIPLVREILSQRKANAAAKG